MTAIDLNADLGEGYGTWTLGDDAALLPLLTSANIACGFHAGDPSIMRRTCALAAEHDVTIGAQVGYQDLRGFGRRVIQVPPPELIDDIVYQIGALQALARAVGTEVRYVKPHGALYNTAADDEAVAEAVVSAAGEAGLPLLGLAGSALALAADLAGVPFFAEAFADRAYTATGRLVTRSQAGSVITDTEEVVTRCLRLASDGVMPATGGAEVAVRADSICLHGDTPGAVGLARAVRSALQAAGVQVRSFVA